MSEISLKAYAAQSGARKFSATTTESGRRRPSTKHLPSAKSAAKQR